MTTALAAMPTNDPAKNLDAFLAMSSYQKEDMAAKLHEIRVKVNTAYSQNDAYSEIDTLLGDADVVNEITTNLKKSRFSPIVSRETQTAVLKGMILDYENGRNRRGLSALTVLKAVELLNKMAGYDAPVKQETTVDHKVHVLPVVGESFTGELPPLDIVDIDATVVMTDEDMKPKLNPASSPNPDPSDTPDPAEPTEPDDLDPEDLFP